MFDDMDDGEETAFWLLVLGPSTPFFIGLVLILWACGVFG